MDTQQLSARTKVFFKKNRKGQVMQLVREHYLRDDITCCYKPCLICYSSSSSSSSSLSSSSISYSSSVSSPLSSLSLPSIPEYSLDPKVDHCIIPDTLFSLKYLEILEHPDVRNIIFLRTVMNEVREPRNLPVQRAYQRVRAIVKSPTRSSIVFNNENFNETYIPRAQCASFKDRYIKVVLKATEYYIKHLSQYKVNIVLVTADTELYTRAKELSLPVFRPDEYLLKFLPSSSSLHELYESLTQMWAEKEIEIEKDRERMQLLENSSEADTKSKPTIFKRYIAEDILEVGVKSGRFYAGTIQVNTHNSEEAYVRLGSISTEFFGGAKRDILVPTKKLANRAIQGDRVVVELLRDSDWKKPFDVLPVEEDEDDSAERSTKMTVGKGIPTGQVIGVLQRNWRDYVATMQVEEGGGKEQQHVLMVPMDRRIPKIRLKTRQADLLFHSRVVCRIDSWDPDSNYPLGHYVRKLGEIGDLETEIMAILVEHDIAITPFSQAIMQSLPQSSKATNGFKVAAEELKYRKDLRNITKVFSIDPLGSQDIDDALSVHEENGKIIVGVHIADVSHYVKPDSPLDIEARARSTTVYLPDRRYDMLPAVLSEDLCSLRGGQDRYAMSVLWSFDPITLEVESTWYGRTIIHSTGELHYQLAQDILDGPLSEEGKKQLKERVKEGVTLGEVRHDLLLLLKIYRELRERRMQKGALELEGTEVRFVLTPGKKNPEKILTKQELEVNRMVAEFMIFANQSVAEKIYSVYPSSGLLRRHALPKLANFDTLIKCANAQGFNIDTSSNSSLAVSLSLAVNPSDPHVNRLLRMLTTQAMTEAEYFSTGSFEFSEYHHYGLALDAYTHFTSPIRRYADIIVHRQLWASLQTSKKTSLPVIEHQELSELAEHINKKHRNSKHAQMHATELFQALYFQNKTSPDESIATGIIFSIRANGLMVYVPKYSLRGSVYLKDKEGKLMIPANAFSKNPHEYQSTIQASDYYLDSDVKLIFSTNKGPVEVKLFDHITVQISVEESRSHLPPIKMHLVHFGTPNGGQSALKDNTLKDKTNNKDKKDKKDEDKKDKQQDKEDEGPTTVKAMAKEIKLAQERKKAVTNKLPTDDYSAYSQPTSADSSMYALLSQLDLLSLNHQSVPIPSLKEEENVVKLWALNSKTIALRDKMHEKMKKYWQSSYSDNRDEYGEYEEEEGERKAMPAANRGNRGETAMDRYKGELTKLERSMKAVQHQRYNARR